MQVMLPLVIKIKNIPIPFCLTENHLEVDIRTQKQGLKKSVWDSGRVNNVTGLCPNTPACVAPRCPFLIRLPNNIQDLHNFLVDNEDYGHIHTHPTEPGNSTFVEPGWGQRERE